MIEVKKGDKVLITSRYRTEVGIVEDITPKGFIKVMGTLFNPQTGRERTSDPYNFLMISPATPEELERFEKSKFFQKVCALMRDDNYIINHMTYNKAVRILNILEEKENENND